MTRAGSAARQRPVFIDTHALLATINADDAHHAVCLEVLGRIASSRTKAITSDWVLAEFLSAASRRPLRPAAIGVIVDLKSSSLTTIVPAIRETWNDAFDLFRTRRDKTWSFVDCTSMVICKALGIKRVLTHDHHFQPEGLEIMLP